MHAIVMMCIMYLYTLLMSSCAAHSDCLLTMTVRQGFLGVYIVSKSAVDGNKVEV